MPDTNDRYDAKIHGSGPVPEPAKVYSDRFKRCNSCPYPRHGLFCWTDHKTCLRTEVASLKSQQPKCSEETRAYARGSSESAHRTHCADVCGFKPLEVLPV